MLADLKHDLEDAQRSLDAARKEADLLATQIEDKKIELKVLHRAASAKRTQVVEVRGEHFQRGPWRCRDALRSLSKVHVQGAGESLMQAQTSGLTEVAGRL